MFCCDRICDSVHPAAHHTGEPRNSTVLCIVVLSPLPPLARGTFRRCRAEDTAFRVLVVVRFRFSRAGYGRGAAAELVLLGGSSSPLDDINPSACFQHAFGGINGRRGAGWGNRSLSSASVASVAAGESRSQKVFIIAASSSQFARGCWSLSLVSVSLGI